MTEPCPECRKPLEIGEWPYCPHGFPGAGVFGFKPHAPYVDYNISTEPVTITNPGDKAKYLRPYWENDHIIKVEPKERPNGYYRELNDRRRARAEKEKREHHAGK